MRSTLEGNSYSLLSLPYKIGSSYCTLKQMIGNITKQKQGNSRSSVFYFMPCHTMIKSNSSFIRDFECLFLQGHRRARVKNQICLLSKTKPYCTNNPMQGAPQGALILHARS